MTREEAIKIIKESPLYDNTTWKYAKELHEAIQTLEQEPCDDAINRADMLDAVGHGTTYTSEEVQNIVNGLPPVTQKQKTGQWIKYGMPRCGEQHYKCTSCGYYINFGQWGELYTKEFRYCPNCSAKMTESEDKK